MQLGLQQRTNQK